MKHTLNVNTSKLYRITYRNRKRIGRTSVGSPRDLKISRPIAAYRDTTRQRTHNPSDRTQVECGSKSTRKYRVGKLLVSAKELHKLTAFQARTFVLKYSVERNGCGLDVRKDEEGGRSRKPGRSGREMSNRVRAVRSVWYCCRTEWTVGLSL
jgi:hypothetical protein